MSAAATAGLSDDDKAQLAAVGIAVEEAERQLDLLRSPPPAIRLERPCTNGDGILSLDSLSESTQLESWRAAAAAGRLTRFVPASGAASRMFDAAQEVRRSGPASRADLEARRRHDDPLAGEVLELIDHAAELPFAEALAGTGPLAGVDLAAIDSASQISRLLDGLLTPNGLDLPALAKGLIPFHQYPSGARTAFEEHLAEGANLLADRRGLCRFHFTVSAPQRSAFEAIAPTSWTRIPSISRRPSRRRPSAPSCASWPSRAGSACRGPRSTAGQEAFGHLRLHVDRGARSLFGCRRSPARVSASSARRSSATATTKLKSTSCRASSAARSSSRSATPSRKPGPMPRRCS